MKKAVLFILIILLFSNCSRLKKNIYQETFFGYDTIITLSIVNISEKQFNFLIQNIKSLVNKYDLIFNSHNKKSELYRIKFYKTHKKYKVSPELYYVLKTAKQIYKNSNGLFDPTIGILNEVYNFSGTNHNIPLIKNYKNNIGYSNLILLKNNTILLKKNITIDLGGISKGYIIDKIADYLKVNKTTNFLINIGGDIYANGKNAKNQKWVIGIQHPRKQNKIIFKYRLTNKSIATSGDYERFFFFNGKRYFHIINPFTGMPADTNIISVTVIREKAVFADALATTIFLLGEKKASQFIKKYYPDTEYFIILKNLKIIKNR